MWVTTHRYLGILLDQRLSFRSHISHLKTATTARLKVMRFLTGVKGIAGFNVLHTLYIHAVRSMLDYSAPCLLTTSLTLVEGLEIV